MEEQLVAAGPKIRHVFPWSDMHTITAEGTNKAVKSATNLAFVKSVRVMAEAIAAKQNNRKWSHETTRLVCRESTKSEKAENRFVSDAVGAGRFVGEHCIE